MPQHVACSGDVEQQLLSVLSPVTCFDPQQAGALPGNMLISGLVPEALSTFLPTSSPAVIAEISAATGRTIAITGPSMA
jgi:hypothetical protein